MENEYYNRVRDEFLEPAGLINKELSFGCEFIGRYGKYEQFCRHTVSRIEKQFVRVSDGILSSCEDIAELVFTKNNSEFFYLKPLLREKMYEVLRKQNKGNFDKWHTIHEILGHPYEMREIMRWIEERVESLTMRTHQGDFFIRSHDGLHDGRFTIDLSKKLHDQDLEPLYSLMKSLSS